MSTSGLTHAPCTKYLLLGTITASLFALSTTPPSTASPSTPTITSPSALVAATAHALGYTHPASLLFALAALYRFRVLERLWGSPRFATFLATALPAALLLPRTLFTFLPAAQLQVPTGHAATVLLHALLSQSHALVPPSWRYASTSLPGLGGVGDSSLKVSAKWSEYAACAQVAIVQGVPGLVCAAVGWGVGLAWRVGVAFVLRREGGARAGGRSEAVDGGAVGASGRSGDAAAARRR